MNVAIIGAGPAGLAAIRHCLEEDVKCVAYEQEGFIGGLRTNLPKELMEFENYPYKPSEEHYITQQEVLDYLHQFAKDFNLFPHIKLNHQVIWVEPLYNGKWSVKVRNTQTDEVTEKIFDGVLLCNGHYTDPFTPFIPGTDRFKGNIIHSQRYRRSDVYKGKRVLVIGGSFSGIDISRLVALEAEKVYLSVNDEKKKSKEKNVINKPVVERFEDHRAIFVDGTEVEIDDVIFCTGYNYNFPFLSEKCQLTIDDNWVKPLYKHLINIEYPSMAIINVTFIVCPFPLFSIQIRFYLALLKGHFKVSKEEMYDDYNQDIIKRIEKKVPNRRAHYIGDQQLEYFEDLAVVANIRRIPRVLGKIFKFFLVHIDKKPAFKILNDEEYEPFFCVT
ncbi:hypothetical protein GWI33_022773 [Rhynchophorus ferrugineus]|uniref:Flavin-containing monooxygenase n=1 Tax=Rhynchophorus ferrugineus TaxID=354439 RepID=A0A834J070_RHYFE|nr:hypothetical protein GWI33_022773 [Rhynchophorus ferrugineus]